MGPTVLDTPSGHLQLLPLFDLGRQSRLQGLVMQAFSPGKEARGHHQDRGLETPREARFHQPSQALGSDPRKEPALQRRVLRLGLAMHRATCSREIEGL